VLQALHGDAELDQAVVRHPVAPREADVLNIAAMRAQRPHRPAATAQSKHETEKKCQPAVRPCFCFACVGLLGGDGVAAKQVEGNEVPSNGRRNKLDALVRNVVPLRACVCVCVCVCVIV
jgi:hypothetical protein